MTPKALFALAKIVSNHRFDGSARPALPYSSISSISSNEVIGQNGILEVEYGEYSQTVVSEDFSRTLERAYSNRTINQTGKSYTTDSVSNQDKDTPFQARTHIEYEYNGRKYIRLFGDSNSSREVLSDGRTILDGSPYWVEVEPIKWMIDERTNIALSKKLIFSGVQFNRERNYKRNFNRTDIKEFMDRHFSKDITPSFSREINPEEKKQIEVNKAEAEKRRNPYGFNLGQVSEEDIIKGAIESGVAVFLHGPSSEGKSARVKQIDPECVIIYLRNATPESLNGKSVYNSETGEMIDVKPTWLKKLEERCASEPDKYHIVFLDEITNALPSIQGIAFNIVLDREVNGIWQLPENSRVVAAGNDMKESLAANQLAEPLFNRFAHVYIQTTVENGVISANLEEQPIPETEIVLDTSGSINETLLKNFLRECKNILQHSRLKVGCFDTKFYGFHEIRTEEDIDNMKFEGGGGTNLNVAVGAFSRRVENKIIFTDGDAYMPDMPLDAIWIVFGGIQIKPKGGKVIQIDAEQLDRLYFYHQDNSYKEKSR